MGTVHTKEQKALANLLRDTRNALGMKQIPVSKKLGITQSTLSKIEAGEIGVGIIKLKKFAEIYKKPLGYFLKNF